MGLAKLEILESWGGVAGLSASGYILSTSSSEDDERIWESPSASVK